MRFVKKPVEVEARQLRGDNEHTIAEWCGGRAVCCRSKGREWYVVEIPTLEGTMTAHQGYWIVRGIAGEFYPVAPLIFDQTYEPATPRGDR